MQSCTEPEMYVVAIIPDKHDEASSNKMSTI